MSRAIRKVSNGQIITINDISDVYGAHKQKVLDGMVDGRTYVFADDNVEMTAEQAPAYLNEKLKELVDREAEVERKEAAISQRFREVVEREIAAEDKAAELAEKEKELSDRYAHLISRENEIGDRHSHLISRENELTAAKAEAPQATAKAKGRPSRK